MNVDAISKALSKNRGLLVQNVFNVFLFSPGLQNARERPSFLWFWELFSCLVWCHQYDSHLSLKIFQLTLNFDRFTIPCLRDACIPQRESYFVAPRFLRTPWWRIFQSLQHVSSVLTKARTFRTIPRSTCRVAGIFRVSSGTWSISHHPKPPFR